ncbi:MAG: glycosyltransferase family 4 protein [Winogradskyella sp.]
MRVTYIVRSINGTTGLERMILFQTNYFINKFNYEIDIVLLNTQFKLNNSNFEINDKIKFTHLKCFKDNSFGYLTKVNSINKAIKKINPDVIMVCIDEIFGLTLGLFLTDQIPKIYQRHTTKQMNLGFSSESFKDKVINFIKTQLIVRSGFSYDKFVVLSEEHKSHWSHLNNLEVINNPITTEYSNKGAELKNKVVIAVGRQSYEKGFDMLLRSWKKVLDNFPDWTLKIYGNENPKLALKDLAKELLINDNVQFYNHTSNIEEVYLGSSLLVCSSRIEGFPLVLLEAMALGVPVVSFDCDIGPRAIIKDNEDGLLVPLNDIDELCNSIKILISNYDLRQKLGKKAKENIIRFSPELVMNNWKILIEELVI